MPTEAKPSQCSIDCHDAVHVVEFSPYEWSNQLIAFGTSTRVTVGTCRFQEEAAEVDGVEFGHIRDFHHGPRVTTISWSPETTILALPKVIRFCTGGTDKKIRFFSSDLKEDIVKLGEGHTDYINAVAYEPDKGELVASVSDDHTCRIWGNEGDQQSCLPLGAPGMAVCWHAQEPMKILVANKKGMICFYNVSTQQPIMSLDCGQVPLLSADWCHSSLLKVAAVASNDWFIFDTSRSSRPIDSRQAHTEGCQVVRWSRVNDYLLATLGLPASQFRVFNTKTNQVLVSSDAAITSGVSWHAHLPLVAVGGDKKVNFWTLESI